MSDVRVPAVPPSSQSYRARRVSYVLIAEPDIARAARYLQALSPHRVGVLVARDGAEALAVLRQFGVPLLLIADVSLPRCDGFAVMETLRAMDGGQHASIIALSAFPDLHAYAAHRSDLHIAAVVTPRDDDRALRTAIDAAMIAARSVRDREPHARVRVRHILREAADEASQVAHTAGAAIYVKVSAGEEFRAHVTWTSPTGGVDSPFAAPAIFDWVVRTGEAAVFPDLALEPFSEPSASFSHVVRGLIAVPVVTDDGAAVGALCVFDVKPLTTGNNEVEALKILARQVAQFVL
jgi:CheY-like chemotaxis protein